MDSWRLRQVCESSGSALEVAESLLDLSRAAELDRTISEAVMSSSAELTGAFRVGSHVIVDF